MFSPPHTLGLSRKLQEDGTITVVLHDSVDEQYLAPVAMTCLNSTSVSKVQSPYLRNTCCALV
jgi:hypothetical protein